MTGGNVAGVPAHMVSGWLTNGAMQMIPGSHLRPTWKTSERTRRVHTSKAKVVELPAGGMVFHHCEILHCSGGNRSNRPRRASLCGSCRSGHGRHVCSRDLRAHPSRPSRRGQFARTSKYQRPDQGAAEGDAAGESAGGPDGAGPAGGPDGPAGG